MSHKWKWQIFHLGLASVSSAKHSRAYISFSHISTEMYEIKAVPSAGILNDNQRSPLSGHYSACRTIWCFRPTQPEGGFSTTVSASLSGLILSWRMNIQEPRGYPHLKSGEPVWQAVAKTHGEQQQPVSLPCRNFKSPCTLYSFLSIYSVECNFK